MKTSDIKCRKNPFITRTVTVFCYKILAVVPDRDGYTTEEFDIKEFKLRGDAFFVKWCKARNYKFVEVIRLEQNAIRCTLPIDKFFYVCQEYENEKENGVPGQLSFDDLEG